MTRTVQTFLCLLLAAACLLTACGDRRGGEEPEPDYEDYLSGSTELVMRQASDSVFTLNYDPEASINPIRSKSAVNLQFSSLIYDSVFTVDEDFNWSSEIVTEYRTEDFAWWVFEIDTSIVFSDGTPMTAADVAYSIRLAQQSSQFGGRLSCIYGVSALSDESFAISAAQAISRLPAMLNIPIIKKGDAYEDYPLGTGPYMLDRERCALVLNPLNRHASEMPLKAVHLRPYLEVTARIAAFDEAALDLVTNDPTGLYNLGYGGTNETRYYDTTCMHYIGFNTQGNFFQSGLVRAAVGRLVDRTYVVESLMNGCGVAAALPVHPRTELYDEAYAASLQYDPAMAERLFRDGGVEDLDQDGALEVMVTGIIVELDIKFIVNNDSTVKVREARRLTEELNALGVTTTLYELSWEDYTNALIAGEYDMYYGEIMLSADWNLGKLFAVPGEKARKEGLWGMNYARNTDENYAARYAEFLGAPEGPSQKSAFLAAAQYVGENGFIIPICFERREILTHRGVVSGIRATQYDLFHRFVDWTFDFGGPEGDAPVAPPPTPEPTETPEDETEPEAGA